MESTRRSAPGAPRYLLLVNPTAGGGRAARLLPAIESELRRRGLAYGIHETTGIDGACAAARTAAEAGEIPVVVSGDGLIGRVGGALANTGAALGVIPGGRGNDLARVVGIPTEPAGAVAVLAADRRRRIDVGQVNGKRFLCIASCGFDSDANRIANDARLVRGPLVYAYAALRALWQWRMARFRVLVDGVDHSFAGYSVAVANSRAYGGGMFIAPDALLDDGELDVISTGEVTRLRFLFNLPKVFKGTHVNEPPVGTARGRVVEIDADRPFAIYADGDHLADLPARLEVLPAALELIAPPQQ